MDQQDDTTAKRVRTELAVREAELMEYRARAGMERRDPTGRYEDTVVQLIVYEIAGRRYAMAVMASGAVYESPFVQGYDWAEALPPVPGTLARGKHDAETYEKFRRTHAPVIGTAR